MEYTFYIQNYWATCACPEKQSLPWNFSLYSSFFQGVLGTRFGSLELKIGSLESAKIIIGSLELEKSGPYKSIPDT